MFGSNIWNFYASCYDKLWAQKFVLTPSRNLILKTIAELPPPENILDVGCGIGQLCHSMSQHYPTAKIIGIDPSVKMIDRAKECFSGENIHYDCIETESLSTDLQFDLIVSTNAFPYIRDKKMFLDKIKLHLKPNGRLLLLFANNNNLYDALWLMFVKLTTSKANYLSVSSTQQLLNESGFVTGRIQRIESSSFLPSVFMVEGSIH
jgi:2-polyprenyl-3-methyl-5-hydroxy-6-metoxy-1,4-benzoquinol methylase